MDARLDPSKYAGLSEGDAHVIRNAGGRATDDAIRSLVISYKLLGTQEWFVIHHSDCGMQLFNDQIIAELLEHDLETASIDASTGKWSPAVPFFSGSSEGKFIKWHTFNSLEVCIFMLQTCLSIAFLSPLKWTLSIVVKRHRRYQKDSRASFGSRSHSYLRLLLRRQDRTTSARASS